MPGITHLKLNLSDYIRFIDAQVSGGTWQAKLPKIFE